MPKKWHVVVNGMINSTTSCTGCGACVQKCPQGCITLTENHYGFVYPEIDEKKCIACNLCNKVCHLECNTQNSGIPKAYAAVHKDATVAFQSTSGGIFSAIAEKVLADGGAVYGCAYSEGLKPCHIRVDAIENLDLLRRSKYVQSDINNTYSLALKDLEENRPVFFTGTPCQIVGLKAFLGKEYDSLITADLICHGVPSYASFRTFIEWYEKKNKCKVLDYNFRSKENSGWSSSGTCTIEKEGKISKRKAFYFDNYYYHYFLEAEIYRDSCYSCRYASIQRTGDFTLGDFWGVESIKLIFKTENGCSLLLVNTKKGEKLLKDMDIDLQEVSLDTAMKGNGQLREPSKHSENRADILEEFLTCSAEEIQKNYYKRYWKKRLLARIKSLVPKKIKNILLMYKYRA